MIASNSSSEKSCNGANPAMPALRNKTSCNNLRYKNSSLGCKRRDGDSRKLLRHGLVDLFERLVEQILHHAADLTHALGRLGMLGEDLGRIQRAVDVQARDPPRIAPEDEATGLAADRLDQACARQLAEDPADDHGVRPHTEGDVLRAKDLRGAE